tara:strand:- start:357 stop:602 length:246 start_codon:yes stop_codon:yes gene_type:complete
MEKSVNSDDILIKLQNEVQTLQNKVEFLENKVCNLENIINNNININMALPSIFYNNHNHNQQTIPDIPFITRQRAFNIPAN